MLHYKHNKKQRGQLMFTLLEKLKTKLGDAITIEDEGDETYSVEINLGKGWAGSYDGGYWGNCEIENDELNLHFFYGKMYGDDDVTFGEGIVQLKYNGGTEENGLAYTGELDTAIGDKVEALTGGLITCGGSEQGMQGHSGDDESYLSVDMEELN